MGKITLWVDEKVYKTFKALAEGVVESNGDCLIVRRGGAETVVRRWRSGGEAVCRVATVGGTWTLSRYEDGDGNIFLSVNGPYNFTLTFSFYHVIVEMTDGNESIDLSELAKRLCTF
jgi:hypothetical protein